MALKIKHSIYGGRQWEEVESARDTRLFHIADDVMMIIPALVDDMFHVIIAFLNCGRENGIPHTASSYQLLSGEDIKTKYNINL